MCRIKIYSQLIDGKLLPSVVKFTCKKTKKVDILNMLNNDYLVYIRYT